MRICNGGGSGSGSPTRRHCPRSNRCFLETADLVCGIHWPWIKVLEQRGYPPAPLPCRNIQFPINLNADATCSFEPTNGLSKRYSYQSISAYIQGLNYSTPPQMLGGATHHYGCSLSVASQFNCPKVLTLQSYLSRVSCRTIWPSAIPAAVVKLS